MEDNYRFFIAIILSLFVILSWQFLLKINNNNIAKTISLSIKEDKISIPNNYSDNLKNTINDIEKKDYMSSDEKKIRSKIINQSPRIVIDTPELFGSINLIGGKIDDIFLKNYHINVNKDSPKIALLNPGSTSKGYFVEFGFSGNKSIKGEIPRDYTIWKIKGNNKYLTPYNPVELIFDNGNGIIFQRKISIDKQYMFTFEDSIKNLTQHSIKIASYGRIFRVSPEKKESTYLLHEGMIGVIGDYGLKTKTYNDLYEANKEDRIINFQKAKGGWIGITDKYWGVVLIPDQNILYKSNFSFNDNNIKRYQADFIGEDIYIKSGESINIINNIFIGAKKVDLIDSYEKKFHIKKFGLLIDWGILHFITKPMFMIIDWLYKLVNNFGLAILLVTILLKIFLFPLANKSYKSMARMKKIQPYIIKIKNQYPEDKVKQQKLIIDLYNKENINPLAGCWPLLIQFPIFFALYKVLYITIEMRHAPFFLWIEDLASPDPTSIFNLFGLFKYEVPQFFSIGFWPIFMGITMFLQMRMNPAPQDKTQAFILNWMPLIFTWMLASFPAGLIIYWTWNNILSILQQAIIMKIQGVRIEFIDNIKKLFV